MLVEPETLEDLARGTIEVLTTLDSSTAPDQRVGMALEPERSYSYTLR